MPWNSLPVRLFLIASLHIAASLFTPSASDALRDKRGTKKEQGGMLKNLHWSPIRATGILWQIARTVMFERPTRAITRFGVALPTIWHYGIRSVFACAIAHTISDDELSTTGSRRPGTLQHAIALQATFTMLGAVMRSHKRAVVAIMLIGGSMAAHAATYEVFRVDRPDGNPAVTGQWATWEEALRAAAKQMSATVRCTDGLGGYYSDYQLVGASQLGVPTSEMALGNSRFGATDSHGDFIFNAGCGYAIRTYSRACTTSCPEPKQTDEYKNACGGAPESCSVVGNPINIGLRAKVQEDQDYVSPGSFPLTFERRYYSNASDDIIYLPFRTLGKRWRHNYDRTVQVQTFGSTVYAGVLRPDGRILRFQQAGSVWTPAADIVDTLVQLTDGSGNPTGWQYVTAQLATETYDVNGRLVSIADRYGMTQTLIYSTSSTPVSVAPVPGLLISVADEFGKQLRLTYNSAKRITTLTDPAGGVFTYAYNSNGMLASVIYPDTKVRSYVYGESAYMQAVPRSTHLTGIVDESGNRFATFSYNSSGQAIGSEHAGGAESVTVAYTVNSTGDVTSAAVTDALGTTKTRQFGFSLGVIKNTGQIEPGRSLSKSYDNSGNIKERTDFNGNKTCYEYDLTLNL